MKIFRFLLLSSVLLLGACRDEGKTSSGRQVPLPTEEEIYAYYDLYLKGDYPAFVAAMHSCDDKPETYRVQMAELFKQHAKDVAEKFGGVKAVKVQRIDSLHNGNTVNVFLVSQYGDGHNEEVLLPMVFVDGKWRLQ